MSSFEKSLLGHMTEVSNVSTIWDAGLKSDVFEDPTNAQVFDFIVKYWLDATMDEVPPATVLDTEFPAFKPDPGTESLTWLIGELNKRYARNQAQELLVEVAEELNDDPIAALSLMHSRAWASQEVLSARHSRVDFSSQESIDQRRKAYADLVDSDVMDKGAPIGLPEIDAHTGGLQPGELGIVVAYTKVGKSFLLTNAAIQAKKALDAGFNPLVLTFEQSVPEFMVRLDCYNSGVGYGKMSRGKLSLDETNALHAAQDEMRDKYGKLHVESMERGERTVPNVVNRARQIGANYIIIDQLSHLDAAPSRFKKTTTERHSEIIFDLKDEIARESAGMIPCFMAVQFNREADAAVKSGERPQLRQIANSADIERTVDIAFGLSRTREMRANRMMLLDIMASRRSDEAAWLLHWHLNNRTEMSVIGPYEEPTTKK